MKSIYLRSFVLKLMVLVVILLAFVNTIKTQSTENNSKKSADNTVTTNMVIAKKENLGK